MAEFLSEIDPRPLRNLPDGSPTYLSPVEFYLGTDPDNGRDITVRVLDAERPPTQGDLEKLWQSMAQTMVLVLVARYQHKGEEVVDLAGGRRKMPADAPRNVKPRPLIVQKVPIAEARNFCSALLNEDGGFAANRLVARWMDERATDMPGLKNDGLFARHALLTYVPDRVDWVDSGKKAVEVRDQSGRDLMLALGFRIDEASEPNAVLLTVEGAPTAAALFLEGAASFDEPSAQYGAISPVTHALAVAQRHRVSWVILTRKRSIRLHPVSPDLGVGRRGRTTTYVEINLDMLPEDRSALLWLLFSSEALADDGTVNEILAASERFATDLGTRLRERVYNDVVPDLATALGRQLVDSTDEDWLSEAYHRTMVVLFRLLFVAYAEDKGLLPYERNSSYTKASLKSLAQELIPYLHEDQEFSAASAVIWRRVVNLWRAVDKGKSDWGIPPYNGGLFSTTSPTGKALNKLELSDAEFGPVLAHLLVDVDDDNVEGPVDFRSLSVREFGSIYEGLLESELSVAEADLTVDRKGIYFPAGNKDEVVVPAGEVYFHNASGARKSSGSYFTKPFAVEHLLDHALEPAIADHFTRVLADLERGDDAAAARRFFDFRCVDISMGSGHFLVAAVDRLEARFSEFLDEHPIPAVTRELEALRRAAINELRHCADDALIENAALLRRQIARRCVYGVDLNSVSVELARLAIWIHTFVPGLPLSFLDHNLVAGNSLTGIGTLDEAAGSVDQNSFVASSLEDMIGKARPALERLATVTDATVADVAAARVAHEDARSAIADAENLFDLLVLNRAGLAGITLFDTSPETVNELHRLPAVAAEIATLTPLHYPTAFPEVFLRDRPGFDCIIGNPPWETVKVEEHKWWSMRFPRLRGGDAASVAHRIAELRSARPDLVRLLEQEREAVEVNRRVLLANPTFRGAGDLDLSEAFAWRFQQLSAASGAIGVVLPRAVLSNSGSSGWRISLLDDWPLVHITTLKNTGRWVFDDVGEQYGFVLLSCHGSDEPGVHLAGPFADHQSFKSGVSESRRVAALDVKSWSPTAIIPSVDSDLMLSAYLRMEQHAGFTSNRHPWDARFYNEVHASQDKALWIDATSSEETLPVYKGSSFALWTPDTGVYYAMASREGALRRLSDKRKNQARGSRGAFAGMPTEWSDDRATLPIFSPRIAWRMVARSTDTRTFIASVLPPDVLVTHHSYCVFFRTSELGDDAFLLAVFSSTAFDWLARRVVEINLTGELVASLPIPIIERDNRLRRRAVALMSRLVDPHPKLVEWLGDCLMADPAVETLDRQEALIELDALVCMMYGLRPEEAAEVVRTCHQSVADRSEAICKRMLELEEA